MSKVYEEMVERNAKCARIERMIDQCKRMENSLREVHDERRALGGGSRARIGNLLACAEDAADFITREIHRLQMDYPGTVRESEPENVRGVA